MTRRQMLAMAAGAPLLRAQGADVAVVLDVATGKVLRAHREAAVRTVAAPPGSAMKPLALFALLEAGKLRADDAYPCPGQLKLGGRDYACAHPKMGAPVDVASALAYSCNAFVARAALRFEAGELAAALGRFGLKARKAGAGEASRLQALGEEHVAVTVLDLANAYRRLAKEVQQAKFAVIRDGLEAAVEFGTAQLARIDGVKVAGKTGTAARQYAWFAGFAPSRDPRVAVAVMTQGRAGGADAAPIAARLLEDVL